MKLVAQMIVAPIEVDRYLMSCVDHLLGFCDQVLLLCEGDVDIHPAQWDGGQAKIVGGALPAGSFYAHEGKARQRLLELTQQLEPTHVLAIDADEFVSDGQALRVACESECPVLTLNMQEVWGATSTGLTVRQDGGWREHQVPIVWRAPDRLTAEWRIRDMALACGREPEPVRAYQRRDCVEPTGVDVLHFGWTNKPDRQRRYDRYVTHDNGRFHNRAHLDSIMWRDSQVSLTERPWPAALGQYSHEILKVANP